MGCNKSKSQHGGAEACDNGDRVSPWQTGYEPQTYYGENFELNQNEISNSGYHHSGNFGAYSDPQTGFRNSNVTGSFGAAAPVYNSYNDINSEHYYGANDYGVNIYNNFSQEHMQSTYIQHQHQSAFNQQHFHGVFYQEPTPNQEQIMGPPSRPVSAMSSYNTPRPSRRLARCNSFNGNQNHYQTAHNNTMVRHGSLENIATGYRSRYSRNNFASDDNLFQNSAYGNEVYPRNYNSRRRNLGGRGRQRGLKRNSWDDDSTNSNCTLSDSSSPKNDNISMPDVGPRVKRRPSNVDDQAIKPEDSTREGQDEKEETNSNDCKRVVHSSVIQLGLDDEPFDILDLLMFPEEWSSCAIDGTGLIDISLTSPEGNCVRRYFNRTSHSKDFKLCITAITRIENPFMHSHYLLRKKEIQSRSEHVDELYLYHGTKKEHLSGILEDNLNWRLYSEKHRFGQGVSFSPLATYSSHYSDKTSEKVMLLFKVLTANSIGGSPDMKVPPVVDKVVYDTSIKEDTTVIVKYTDHEFYPLYKLSYTKIMRNS